MLPQERFEEIILMKYAVVAYFMLMKSALIAYFMRID